jgi:IMP cyclohydrolase
MYVGRFVVVGPDVAAYRVSSRSFPNREIRERESALTVGPTEAAEPMDNPYVEYNCVRTTEGGAQAVLGNGSHVDPIVEKLDLGYPARDALVSALFALDFEKDDYDTPRVAGVLDDAGDAYVGIVRRDALLVEAVDEPTVVATYETDAPEPFALDATDAASAAAEVYEHEFEHAVCAAGVARNGDEFETAVYNS